MAFVDLLNVENEWEESKTWLLKNDLSGFFKKFGLLGTKGLEAEIICKYKVNSKSFIYWLNIDLIYKCDLFIK